MTRLAIVFAVLPLAASAATITVNNTADNLTAGNGACTLREAIANVNAAAETSGGDCTAGSGGGDTIAASIGGQNELGILARVANPDDAGSGEDYVAVYHDSTNSWANQMRSTDNNEGSSQEFTSTNRLYMRLQRTGTVFTATISSDGVTWLYPRTVTRNDMAGLPLQVGLSQANSFSGTEPVRFDYFQITGPAAP